uniref:Myb-like domain-containing protein n=1 Tax=Grammatophora oceanica TaxID=210454 RepID=A0A7S1Y5C2_9STRA|mmetsp:Transcript_27526/g.40452  ORF Transcript_27526/g.40452 Transcript_27526/m.40452 type:complete len:302 (+) Transcript_27526:148-1053(+)|eukprot:CAMPEP_0194038742 /NCGR_PEP_ID=MMETSP0009_2-20130614/10957_1 /TAXON_ID=210454 /ORGANISM="Grammatophora oceanica, Strain CCMP 410" /LENGTH=301 /DNA_ID=CAMNT_0038681343 /DNA_START=132 /DNA_END=1037 /DNA_ORIENTATION=+
MSPTSAFASKTTPSKKVPARASGSSAKYRRKEQQEDKSNDVVAEAHQLLSQVTEDQMKTDRGAVCERLQQALQLLSPTKNKNGDAGAVVVTPAAATHPVDKDSDFDDDDDDDDQKKKAHDPPGTSLRKVFDLVASSSDDELSFVDDDDITIVGPPPPPSPPKRRKWSTAERIALIAACYWHRVPGRDYKPLLWASTKQNHGGPGTVLAYRDNKQLKDGYRTLYEQGIITKSKPLELQIRHPLPHGWTMDEVDELLEGVAKYGPRWNRILREFDFAKERRPKQAKRCFVKVANIPRSLAQLI